MLTKERKSISKTSLLLAVVLLLILSACQSESLSDKALGSPQNTAVTPKSEPVQAEAVEAATPESESAEAEPVEAVPSETALAEATPLEAEPVQAEPVETASPTWTAHDISLPMADGLKIAGIATLPENSDPVPAVLLLHMLGSNQQAWMESDLLAMLNEHGYATMTIDMRGHGATGGSNDWDLAETDLQVVWQYLRDLPEVDGQATAVIGASIGANMALRLAANVPQINTAVLLSPGLDYRGVTTKEALVQYGERPLFLSVSDGDTYASESVSELFDHTAGPKNAKIYEGTAHGTQMLTVESGLSAAIISWLDAHVKKGEGIKDQTSSSGLTNPRALSG